MYGYSTGMMQVLSPVAFTCPFTHVESTKGKSICKCERSRSPHEQNKGLSGVNEGELSNQAGGTGPGPTIPAVYISYKWLKIWATLEDSSLPAAIRLSPLSGVTSDTGCVKSAVPSLPLLLVRIYKSTGDVLALRYLGTTP